jgi:phenylpyruvate tautomerase PptA (4-oxalocrotonate tautomerase family)
MNPLDRVDMPHGTARCRCPIPNLWQHSNTVGQQQLLKNPENSMPYLQLDVTRNYPALEKKQLAAAMCETYARLMSVDIRRISVAIRELGEGSLWRIAEAGAEPVEVSMLMLDIRRGRPADLRMEVAKALCAHCIEILGLRGDRLNVEFTQHDGDEMYHPTLGGYSPDWKPGEA